MSYTVVCVRWDGEFDHAQGFKTLSEAEAYIAAQQPRHTGCTFRICSESEPLRLDSRNADLLLSHDSYESDDGNDGYGYD